MKTLICLSVSMISLGACQASNAEPDLIKTAQQYATLCASCHGADMSGGQAPTLLDDVWNFGSADAEIAHVIANGIDEVGMPGFKETLSEPEVKSMVQYIRNTAEGHVVTAQVSEVKATINDSAEVQAVTDVPSVADQVVIEDFVTGLDEPWGFAFLGVEDVLITEKTGDLLYVSHFPEPMKIEGIPTVNNAGQGGMLDVALDPDYQDNGWVYLAYSHPLKGSSGPSMTKVVRGQIEDFKWTNEQVIFEARPDDYINTGYHYGTRITFDDQGHLFFGIGDRGKMDMAQDVKVPNGKIHRINRDGSIPDDNPFVGVEGAYPSIYSFGNRNPQGLVWHPDTGVLWETEHGPRGGDELNFIQAGINYGWPEISYGINYSGTILTEYKSKPGMAQPASHWTPSIAVCGLDVYTGDMFPEWNGRLLAGSLANQTVRLIDVEGTEYKSESILIQNEGRVRQVKTGPDGAIYVALPGRIVRVTPKT